MKLCAYEIETRLCTLAAPAYARSADEGRALIRDILQAPGTIRCVDDRLEVHLDQLATPRATEALLALCAALNARAPTSPKPRSASTSPSTPAPSGSDHAISTLGGMSGYQDSIAANATGAKPPQRNPQWRQVTAVRTSAHRRRITKYTLPPVFSSSMTETWPSGTPASR